MAIYMNREVSVVSTPTISDFSVRGKDGQTYRTGSVRLTAEEKKKIIEDFTKAINEMPEVSEDDLKAVRAGVAPSYDPSRLEQVQNEVNKEEADKIDQQMKDKAKADLKSDKPVSAYKVK